MSGRIDFPKTLILLGLVANAAAVLAFSGGDFALFASQEVAPFYAGLAAVVLLLAFTRPWTYLLAGVLVAALPLMVLLLVGAWHGLLSPVSRGEFTSGLLMLASIALSLTGGIGGFRAARRGATPGVRAGFGSTAGRALTLAGVLLLGAALTGALAASNAATLVANPGHNLVAERTLALTTADFAFSPKTFEVEAGELTELVVTNEDGALHTFSYEKDGKRYDHTLLTGETRILLLFQEKGEFRFWCAPHSAGAADEGAGMVGSFTVV